MSSSVFAAHNDGPCGLADLARASGHVCQDIAKGEQAFYLTCQGNVPDSVAQLTHSRAEDGYRTGYRIKVTGTRSVTRNVWDPARRRRVPTTIQENEYGWEERIGQPCAPCVDVAQNGVERRVGRGGRSYSRRPACSCQWRTLAVWSNLVHVDCAQALGFNVPGRGTVARRGSRTVGREHRAADSPAQGTRTEVSRMPYAGLPPQNGTRVMHRLTAERDATACGITFGAFDGTPEQWSNETTSLVARVTCVACNAVETQAATPLGRQREAVNSLGNVAAEMASQTEATANARNVREGQGRYMGTGLDGPEARAERARATAERERLARERTNRPAPVVTEAKPALDIPEDVEDAAAFQRFARLELD